MAAFEDNNPFASPASPTSSRANSYAPFGGYNYSPTTSGHNPQPSLDSFIRPTTSSSDDAPAYHYRATNSDFSADHHDITPSASVGIVGVGLPTSREEDGESCCKIAEMRIIISDAGKASDGGANFIAYTIEVGVCTLPF
jgi:hypothetical protein